MEAMQSSSCTAFAGGQRLASGPPDFVALRCKAALDAGEARTLLIFDDTSARPVELDLRGSSEDVARRHASPASSAPAEAEPAEGASRPGRPRLGVVGREVTLLPRHWEWLNAQPGGASVALRKLIDQARREHEAHDRARLAQEAAFRFLNAIAGNEPGFEEAVRALFAADRVRFEACARAWSPDVREHALRLAQDAFQAAGA